MMLTIILAAATVVCAAGWCVNRIGVMSLLRYLQKNNYPMPTDEELSEISKWVVGHIFKNLT